MPQPSPNRDPHPAAASRAHRRLAVLSAIGALVVALPLVQVLRFQVDELAALRLDRAGLDPLARTVDAQVQLSLHREIAGDVLRGQMALEPRRTTQQARVDVAVAALAVELTGGAWPRARAESDALGTGWQALASAIAARRIDAGQSNLSHRLLIEHCLQITDDLAAAGVRHSGPRADATATLLRQMQALPREIWRTAETPSLTPRSAEGASAALTAHWQHFTTLQASAARALDDRGRTLRHRRAAVLAALGALVGVVLFAVGALLRPTRVAALAGDAALHEAPLATSRLRDRTRADASTVDALLRMRDAEPRRRLPEAPSTLPPT